MNRFCLCLVAALAFAGCNNPVSEGGPHGGSGSASGGSSGGGSSGSAGTSGSSSSGGGSGSAGSSGGSSGGVACTADGQCPAGDYCNFSVAPCAAGGAATDVPGSCEPDCGNSCGSCSSDADCSPAETCLSSGRCGAFGGCLCANPGPCAAPCALVNPPHDCCQVCLCPSCRGSGSSGGTTAGTSGGSSGGGCDPASCYAGEVCCPAVNHCVDTRLDTQNCGGCGQACPVGDVCQAGGCVTAPCSSPAPLCSSADICCGQACCGVGQICCDESGGGPARQYPYGCVDADAGCPPPCLMCAPPEPR